MPDLTKSILNLNANLADTAQTHAAQYVIVSITKV